jgi:hypothetical protein
LRPLALQISEDGVLGFALASSGQAAFRTMLARARQAAARQLERRIVTALF